MVRALSRLDPRVGTSQSATNRNVGWTTANPTVSTARVQSMNATIFLITFSSLK